RKPSPRPESSGLRPGDPPPVPVGRLAETGWGRLENPPGREYADREWRRRPPRGVFEPDRIGRLAGFARKEESPHSALIQDITTSGLADPDGRISGGWTVRARGRIGTVLGRSSRTGTSPAPMQQPPSQSIALLLVSDAMIAVEAVLDRPRAAGFASSRE